ncbi:MAG TPA: glycosyltransferase family 39 protein, partial [Acidimicrobiales bacterium]
MFALVFRILMIRQFGVPNPNADPLYYHAQANLIADGSGFAEPFTWLRNGTIIPSALHPPGFSLWLSIASVMGFRTVFSHQVMSAVAGTVLVLVVALVAGRLAGARAAVVAALLAALHPNLWVIDGTLMPESLYAMTIGFVLLAAYLYLARPSVWSAAAFGAVLAASALVRGEGLLLLPLLAVPLVLVHQRGWRVRLSHLAFIGAAAVLVVAPWTVRNAVAFHKLVPVSFNSEEVIRNANCDVTYYGSEVGFWSYACYQPAAPPGYDEAQRAAFWRRNGVAYI